MIKYLFKKFLLIGLLLLIFGNMQGQGRYPYRYTIKDTRKIPPSYTITYKERGGFTNVKPDSIWIVVKDTFAQNTDSFYSNTYFVSLFSPNDSNSFACIFDSVRIEYTSDLKIILLEELLSPREIIIKDTGTTQMISKITLIKGLCGSLNDYIIYSKIPLRKKTINAIREYKFKKGPEPWVLKKKICKILIVI